MDDVIYRLLLLLNNSKENDIYHTIAKTIIEDIKNIPEMNINKLAQECYTTPSSVINFCKKLGYSGFIEFKEYTENILFLGRYINVWSMLKNNIQMLLKS